jgi:hypothetical protein
LHLPSHLCLYSPFVLRITQYNADTHTHYPCEHM